MIFSGNQLHSTVANMSGRTSFSIEFRTVGIDDVQSRREAPNFDLSARGRRWLSSGSPKMSRSHLRKADTRGCLIRSDSSHRAMLAHAFLVVITATRRRADNTDTTLIALTVNEFRRLFDALLLRPLHTVADILAWSTRRRNTKSAPNLLPPKTPSITMTAIYGWGLICGHVLASLKGRGSVNRLSTSGFAGLSASVRAASGTDRGQDGAPAVQRGRTVLTLDRPRACRRQADGVVVGGLLQVVMA